MSDAPRRRPRWSLVVLAPEHDLARTDRLALKATYGRTRRPPLDLAASLDLLLESTQATNGSLPSAFRPVVVAVAYGCIVGAAWTHGGTVALRLAPRFTRFAAGTREGPALARALALTVRDLRGDVVVRTEDPWQVRALQGLGTPRPGGVALPAHALRATSAFRRDLGPDCQDRTRPHPLCEAPAHLLDVPEAAGLPRRDLRSDRSAPVAPSLAPTTCPARGRIEHLTCLDTTPVVRPLVTPSVLPHNLGNDLPGVEPPFRFFLGTTIPSWLHEIPLPLFVARQNLTDRKTLPRRAEIHGAPVPWCLDSGGFTELNLHSRWRITARRFVEEVRRIRDAVGGLLWNAPMDWMTEPTILQNTGLTVVEHQRRTIQNFLDLRAMAPDLPTIPVLQGWTLDDYRRCMEGYARYGVDLRREPVVGVGTVCRRQSDIVASQILQVAIDEGLRCHGFGFKTTGLLRHFQIEASLRTPWGQQRGALISADSQAWSFRATKHDPLPGHCVYHKHCNNCPVYALQWREALTTRIDDARRATAAFRSSCGLRGAGTPRASPQINPPPSAAPGTRYATDLTEVVQTGRRVLTGLDPWGRRITWTLPVGVPLPHPGAALRVEGHLVRSKTSLGPFPETLEGRGPWTYR